MAYDEKGIARSLTEFSSEGRTQFACACAERLMASFRWYCDATGSGSFGKVRESLNEAWAGLAESATFSDIAGLVPEDQKGALALGSAVAQNAVACVAYALQVLQTDEVEAGVCAARQLYDAADTVVQQGSAEQEYVEDIDREQPVQLMVRGIHAVVDAIQAKALPADLIAAAQQDGDAFLAFVEGHV